MRLLSALVFTLVFVVSGCASHYQYNSMSKPYDFSVGDQVKLWTENKGEVEFKVTKVTDSAVHGDGIEISLEEIQGASVRKLDEWQVEQDFEKGAVYSLYAMWLVGAIALAALAL